MMVPKKFATRNPGGARAPPCTCLWAPDASNI